MTRYFKNRTLRNITILHCSNITIVKMKDDERKASDLFS